MYKLDCLIRDTYLYFVGFHRCLFLIVEEEGALLLELEEQRQRDGKEKKRVARRER